MIDIDRYRRIDEIFQAALELEPPKRTSYISQACSGDAVLLKEVEDLLASDGQQWELIGTPAFEMVAPLLAKDQPELEAGDSIGHYQVVSLLGVGGMGQVYLAEDPKLGRKVALKLLTTSYTRDESRWRRFQQEARAASALNHPNILTIHELGEVNGEQFIATEFVEGETLRERLQRAPLNSAETLDIAVQIAGALAAAHKAGIVHRDIKPENIMLRHDGYVKVLDFGLAKLTEQQEPATETRTTENVDISSGLVMGTVKYMSPEQARGRQVDPRSDIFSFGVVLYEMIAGRPPFEGKNSNELISAILKEEPSPLTDVPDEAKRLISRALRKKKEDRYQTIEDLLADLKSLKEDTTVANVGAQHQGGTWTGPAFSTREVAAISTATTIEYVVSEIKRHKTATALGFVTLVILLSGVGYLGYRYFFNSRSINSRSIHSIAVMPFVNESGDPKLEDLSDGLAGNLIETLSKVPELEVKALSTVVRYKGANSDVRRIGQELNVEAVLFGKLIETGEDLTLQVELVDSRNGNNLWRRTYQQKKSGLVVMQSELTRDLVGKLGAPITDKTRAKLAKHDTENSDAYMFYLRGVNHARKITAQDINEAIQFFSQAIQKDPEYAKAYAALASARRSLTMCCDGQPSEVLQAKLAAQKAVDLDPELAEGHSALAAVIWMYDWNWAEAEKEFQRALDLDPNSSISHFQYGDFLGFMGRTDEAAVQKDRAAELEPFEPFFASRVGRGREPEKALKQILYAISLNPNYWFSHAMAAGVYRQRKEYDKAIAEAQLAKKLSPEQTWSDVILSSIYVDAGKPGEARAILDQLLLRSKSRFVPPCHIARVYNHLGDTEQALDWLEKAYAIHDPGMISLKQPSWKNVENDPRFQDIKRRVGF
jgi:eukaryotic-like serine/threonine-protein kinase